MTSQNFALKCNGVLREGALSQEYTEVSISLQKLFAIIYNSYLILTENEADQPRERQTHTKQFGSDTV